MQAVASLLDYRRRMLRYANEEDLVPGLGHVNIIGGRCDTLCGLPLALCSNKPI
jgi:hypothetical protein